MKPECSSALAQHCVAFWKRYLLREHLLPSAEEWREGHGKSWVVFDSEGENELMKQLKGRYVFVRVLGCHSQCLPPYISTVFRCDRLAFPSQSMWSIMFLLSY